MKVCAEPGCPTLTAAIYCDQHHKQRRTQSDKRRETSTQRGYGPRWRATRKNYLRNHPLCECDDERCTRIATVVHHIDGKGPSGPQGHDPSNLQAMSKQCHDQLTAQLQPGGWSMPAHRTVGWYWGRVG